MRRLHGFSASKYYNIVKLALLEKEQRPTVRRLRADQAADFPAFVAHLQTLYAIAGP